eukprot:4572456-Prymnesium_polylepis.1
MSASFTHHDFDTIHRRFGHCGHRRIRKMVLRSRNFPSVNGTFVHDPAFVMHAWLAAVKRSLSLGGCDKSPSAPGVASLVGGRVRVVYSPA